MLIAPCAEVSLAVWAYNQVNFRKILKDIHEKNSFRNKY